MSSLILQNDFLRTRAQQLIALTAPLTMTIERVACTDAEGSERRLFGFEGAITDCDIAGARIFVPDRFLLPRLRRMVGNGSCLRGHNIRVTLIDVKENQTGRLGLIGNYRKAQFNGAKASQSIVMVRIFEPAFKAGNPEVRGLRGEVVTGALAGLPAFCPASKLPPQFVSASNQLKDRLIYAVVINEGKLGEVVVDAVAVRKLAFDRTRLGDRLRMRVTAGGDEIRLCQRPAKGVPVVGRIVNPANLSPAPKVAEELLVRVVGKEPLPIPSGGNLLVAVEDPALVDAQSFCVECQKEHAQGFCQQCGFCLYKHGLQIFAGNGNSLDGCFFQCEICGRENFWD